MSTIVTSNISDGTDTVGTEYVVNGSAKAWVNFNGTGTVAIQDNLNVSSLTDNTTGDYTFGFTNAFGNNTYVNSGLARDPNDNTSYAFTLGFGALNDIKNSTALTVVTVNYNGGRADMSELNILSTGDLA